MYDPGGSGRIYNDGTFKGMDRYYRAEDLDDATQKWWKYVIIVSRGEFKSLSEEVDINEIIHQSGK